MAWNGSQAVRKTVTLFAYLVPWDKHLPQDGVWDKEEASLLGEDTLEREWEIRLGEQGETRI